jgi:hypothetical protein
MATRTATERQWPIAEESTGRSTHGVTSLVEAPAHPPVANVIAAKRNDTPAYSACRNQARPDQTFRGLDL